MKILFSSVVAFLLAVTLSACSFLSNMQFPSFTSETSSNSESDENTVNGENQEIASDESADDESSTTMPVALGERTGKRYALIIGNGKYDGKYWSQLSNPINDAKDMKKVLESLPKGKRFEVIYLENASHRKMEEAVRNFGKKLKGGGIGLFYYAGHGSQITDGRVESRNYLIPVDLRSDKETDVKYNSLSADYVLETMEEAKNGFNIVILDACRTNGLARGKNRGTSEGGLAAMKESKGAIIAFSTTANTPAQDGSGKNSPYAKHLIAAIKTENLTVEQMFKQVRTKVKEATNGEQSPIEYTQLEGGDFCFVSCPGTQDSAEVSRLKEKAEELRQQAEQERKARLEAEKLQQQSSVREARQQSEEAKRQAEEAKQKAEEAQKRVQDAERQVKEAEKRAKKGSPEM